MKFLILTSILLSGCGIMPANQAVTDQKTSQEFKDIAKEIETLNIKATAIQSTVNNQVNMYQRDAEQAKTDREQGRREQRSADKYVGALLAFTAAMVLIGFCTDSLLSGKYKMLALLAAGGLMIGGVMVLLLWPY